MFREKLTRQTSAFCKKRVWKLRSLHFFNLLVLKRKLYEDINWTIEEIRNKLPTILV
jgi:hypothetical protein